MNEALRRHIFTLMSHFNADGLGEDIDLLVQPVWRVYFSHTNHRTNLTMHDC